MQFLMVDFIEKNDLLIFVTLKIEISYQNV